MDSVDLVDLDEERNLKREGGRQTGNGLNLLTLTNSNVIGWKKNTIL